MKTFKNFVADLLKNGNVMSDEEICTKWIRAKYNFFFVTEKNISIIGKSYESHRKLLWNYRKDLLQEVEREIRKNGSHKIFFKLK